MKKYFILFILCFSVHSNAQNKERATPAEREAVNRYVRFANHCNTYIYQVTNELKVFNKQLNDVHQQLQADNSFEQGEAQKEVFTPFRFSYPLEFEKEYTATKAYKNNLPKRAILLLDQEFDQLYKHTKNILGQIHQLQEASKDIDSYFQDPSFSTSYAQIRNISATLNKAIDTNYKFSLASVIFFGYDASLSPFVSEVKQRVSLSKNIIMYLRDNRVTEMRLYLKELDKSILKQLPYKDIPDIFAIGIRDFDTNYNKVLLKELETFSALSHEYLEKSANALSQKELLQKLIGLFNSVEQKTGMAYVFNSLVRKSKQEEYLHFVYECAPFTPELPDNYSSSLRIQDKIIEEEVNIVEKEPATFNAEDTSSLEGAKTINILLLIDVSKSMQSEDKLPLLKNSIIELVEVMRPEDKIAVAVYSGTSKVIIPTSTIEDKLAILSAIDDLSSGGGTNIYAGLKLANETLDKSFVKHGTNKIILATDGDFTVNPYLKKVITEKMKRGVQLSIFHYGMNPTEKISTNLNTISSLGGGNFKHISSKEDATFALIQEVKIRE